MKLISLNKSELRRIYGVSKPTLDNYVAKIIADPKKPTECEYKQLINALKSLKAEQMAEEVVVSASKDLKSDAKINFSTDKSNIQELLEQERKDYNFFLKCLDIDKQKVQMVENDSFDGDNRTKILLIQTYKKELREDKKTLLNIGARISEYEKELALVDVEENPFGN